MYGEKMVQLHTFYCHPLSGEELYQTAYSTFQAGSKKKDTIILCQAKECICCFHAESLLNIQIGLDSTRLWSSLSFPNFYIKMSKNKKKGIMCTFFYNFIFIPPCPLEHRAVRKLCGKKK